MLQRKGTERPPPGTLREKSFVEGVGGQKGNGHLFEGSEGLRNLCPPWFVKGTGFRLEVHQFSKSPEKAMKPLKARSCSTQQEPT